MQAPSEHPNITTQYKFWWLEVVSFNEVGLQYALTGAYDDYGEWKRRMEGFGMLTITQSHG